MLSQLKEFWAQVWLVDFEFGQQPGDVLVPRCMVAREAFTGRTIRAWADDLAAMHEAPFPVDRSSLFVAYNASSELGNFLALGWRIPTRILDLCFEFKREVNGWDLPYRKDLLGALMHHGLPSMPADEKTAMRELALRGGHYTDREKADLLDYCEQDVVALDRLLPAMVSKIDLGTALLRGRYAPALARMERDGIPIDVPKVTFLQQKWGSILEWLIQSIDKEYGVFDETTFCADKFARYLSAAGIPWPLTKTGRLEMSKEVWSEKAKLFPALEPMRQLLKTRSQLRAWDIPVGKDGRSRCSYFGFSTKTGRNAPKAREFLFALPKWIRGLVRPPEGRSLILADWSGQEYGIVASLSQDPEMLAGYLSGDPYIHFAQLAGALPPGATKKSHPTIREVYKTCTLATLYGQQAHGLAARIGRPLIEAQELLRHHRQIFKKFWAWADSVAAFYAVHSYIPTIFDWRIHRGPSVSPRTIRNFPAQANGAEMMRLAACFMTERWLSVLCPVHDAFLIECRTEDLAKTVHEVKDCMALASKYVLDGFELRVDVRTVSYPDSLLDDSGRQIWNMLTDFATTLPHPSPFTPKEPNTSYWTPEDEGWVSGGGWDDESPEEALDA